MSSITSFIVGTLSMIIICIAADNDWCPDLDGVDGSAEGIKPFGSADYEQPISESGEEPINPVLPFGSVGDIHYYIFTKENPVYADELIVGNVESLTNSNFIPNAPVKVLVHGFMTDLHSRDFPYDLYTAYLKSEIPKLNIIIVDWTILSGQFNYLAAVAHVPVVAEQNANLIKFLVDQGVTTLDQFHLVGHSLGAHVSGDTGYVVNGLMGEKLPRITGLDPAKPLYELSSKRGRIDPSDAKLVDIIHTTGLTTGLQRTLGHIDFYPNGGVFQPGCMSGIIFFALQCSHARSHEYFSESVTNPRGFRACKCKSKVLAFQTCNCTEVDYMGEYLLASDPGVYYLHTNSKPLFGKG